MSHENAKGQIAVFSFWEQSAITQQKTIQCVKELWETRSFWKIAIKNGACDFMLSI